VEVALAIVVKKDSDSKEVATGRRSFHIATFKQLFVAVHEAATGENMLE